MKPFAILTLITTAAYGEKPFLSGEFIFPQEKLHNHSSMVVELPGGELFTAWYRGSGERNANDVALQFSRLKPGAKSWTPPQVLADVPNFPDCNPTVFIDSRKRLWLFWPTIVANEWHTALLQYRVSSRYSAGPPKWDDGGPLLFIPRNFTEKSLEGLISMKALVTQGKRESAWLGRMEEKAKDKYFSRMGWMPRAHPIELPGGRMILPLYSDGYSYSIMAYTDDGGQTWHSSDPIPGAGNIQPSIARAKDGTLVTYMRDNGPPPKRLHVSESKDNGVTWSPVRDTDLPNPGSGAEVINLKDGSWALIYNDTERERFSLAIAISEDEGKTWRWKRHIESQPGGSFHYPSIIQARDGSLHATYSYFNKDGKTIKHAHFNIDWVKQGALR